ncbi:hypothetical protein RFI_30435, partial [Reticulomyxa filosa]
MEQAIARMWSQNVHCPLHQFQHILWQNHSTVLITPHLRHALQGSGAFVVRTSQDGSALPHVDVVSVPWLSPLQQAIVDVLATADTSPMSFQNLFDQLTSLYKSRDSSPTLSEDQVLNTIFNQLWLHIFIRKAYNDHDDNRTCMLQLRDLNTKFVDAKWAKRHLAKLRRRLNTNEDEIVCASHLLGFQLCPTKKEDRQMTLHDYLTDKDFAVMPLQGNDALVALNAGHLKRALIRMSLNTPLLRSKDTVSLEEINIALERHLLPVAYWSASATGQVDADPVNESYWNKEGHAKAQVLSKVEHADIENWCLDFVRCVTLDTVSKGEEGVRSSYIYERRRPSTLGGHVRQVVTQFGAIAHNTNTKIKTEIDRNRGKWILFEELERKLRELYPNTYSRLSSHQLLQSIACFPWLGYSTMDGNVVDHTKRSKDTWKIQVVLEKDDI